MPVIRESSLLCMLQSTLGFLFNVFMKQPAFYKIKAVFDSFFRNMDSIVRVQDAILPMRRFRRMPYKG